MEALEDQGQLTLHIVVFLKVVDELHNVLKCFLQDYGKFAKVEK